MKYYIAVYQKLKEIYQIQSSNENDVPLICPSLRLYSKADLELLKPLNQIDDKSMIGKSFAKKEQIAIEFNSLPSSSNFWDTNPHNILSDVYRDILEKLEPDGLKEAFLKLSFDDEFKLIDNKGKDTKENKAYIKYLALYEKSISDISEHFSKFDDSFSPENKAIWEDQLTLVKMKSKQAFANFEVKGFKDLIEKALNIISKKTELDSYIDLVNTTKSIFNIVEKTGGDSFAAYHNINFIPYDFMSNESGWNSLKLNKSQLDALFETAKENSINLPGEILSLDYDEKYITGIELEYSFVHLKRTWFNKDIFNQNFFKSDGEKQISDGQTISSQFRLPAFPKTMILIKKLKVNLDSTVPTNLNTNMMMYFGPLVLKQQFFVNKATNVTFLKAITNSETIASDQLNYMIKKSAPVTVEVSSNLNAVVETTVLTSNFKADEIQKPIFNRRFSSLLKPQITEANIRPMATIINPQFSELLMVNPSIIVTIPPFSVKPLTKVFINVTDSITKSGVFRSSIAIKGIDTLFSKEIECNDEGKIDVDLAIGRYSIEFTCDGYKVFNSTFLTENTIPVTLNYALERDEVVFKSYFLIGMICEKLPKIPN